MTFADMVLAHSIIERLGATPAGDLIDLLDGDTPPTPELLALARRAQRLIATEFGDATPAAHQLARAASP